MLSDVGLEPCRECFACFEWGEGRCPAHNDAPAVGQKMQDADGVIFPRSTVSPSPASGRPSSTGSPTSSSTVLRQESPPPHHRRRGGRERRPRLPRRRRLRAFDVVSRAGLVAPPLTPQRQALENDRNLDHAAGAFFRALAEGRERRPGLRRVIIFHGQRATFDELADAFPADHAYWKERGWLDPGARYYTSVPVNPPYDAAGRIVERVARRRIRRDLAAMR